MTEKKKREKVVAEITATHVAEIAAEAGHVLTPEEVLTFLNYQGRAYEMWKQMMQAGQDYIKSTLQKECSNARSSQSSRSPARRMVM